MMGTRSESKLGKETWTIEDLRFTYWDGVSSLNLASNEQRGQDAFICIRPPLFRVSATIWEEEKGDLVGVRCVFSCTRPHIMTSNQAWTHPNGAGSIRNPTPKQFWRCLWSTSPLWTANKVKQIKYILWTFTHVPVFAINHSYLPPFATDNNC